MGKDRSKDYATAAFRDFAQHGRVSRAELEQKLYAAERKKTASEELAVKYIKDNEPLLADIDAVWQTVIQLKQQSPDGLRAVEEVYFLYPGIPLRRNDIVMRIRFFALNEGISERTVYFWLKKARHLFSEYLSLIHI